MIRNNAEAKRGGLSGPSTSRKYLGHKWYIYTDGDEAGARRQLRQAFIDLGVEKGTIGVQESTRYAEYLLLKETALEAKIENVSETILDPIRMIKDEMELANIRKSAEAADRLYETAARIIGRGAHVYDIRVELAKSLIDAGADSASIKGGGDLSHELDEGDILDFEPIASVNGYAAETARTFFVGPEPGESARLVWKAIKESYEVIMTHIRPGVAMHELDVAFKDSFKEAMRVIHPNFIRTRKVGHGMGLHVSGHEKPFVQEFNMTKAAPGMVFVIDPGPGPGFFPEKHDYGYGGKPGASIHIISTVLITENGFEVLDKYPIEMNIC
jgi:Xaa-Pro aminopeptidase